MTDQVPGAPSPHYALDALADAVEGLLPAAEAGAVADHLAECADCAERAESLTEATRVLRELSPPVMPPAVAQRLTSLVRGEAQRRASGVTESEAAAGLAEAAKRTDLGSFRQNPILDRDLGSAHGRHRAVPASED